MRDVFLIFQIMLKYFWKAKCFCMYMCNVYVCMCMHEMGV